MSIETPGQIGVAGYLVFKVVQFRETLKDILEELRERRRSRRTMMAEVKMTGRARNLTARVKEWNRAGEFGSS